MGLGDFTISNSTHLSLFAHYHGSDCLDGFLPYPQAKEFLSRNVTFWDCLFQLCKSIFLRNFDCNA